MYTLRKTYELHVDNTTNTLRRVSICFKSNSYPRVLRIVSNISQDKIQGIYPHYMRPLLGRDKIRWAIRPTLRYTLSEGEHLFCGLRIDTNLVLSPPLIPQYTIRIEDSRKITVKLHYKYLHDCTLNIGPIGVPFKVLGGKFKYTKITSWNTRDLGTFNFLEVKGETDRLDVDLLLGADIPNNIAVTLHAKVDVDVLPIVFWLEQEDGSTIPYKDENKVLCVLPDLLKDSTLSKNT